jgi:hypothetical protein
VLMTSLRRSLPAPVAAAVTIVAVFALNLVGLAFTGMEHSLQVLLAVLVATGVVTVVRDGRVPTSLVVAMALGPLIRYENAALSVAAALVLMASGFRRQALVGTASWLAGAAAFSAFLLHLGLDFMPSSVLTKSAFARAPVGKVVAVHLAVAVQHHPFVDVVVAVLLLDLLVVRRWHRLHTFVALVLVAHVVAGDYGGFGRYQVYVLAALVPVLASWVAEWPRRRPHPRLVTVIGVAAACGMLASLVPLALFTPRTDSAARDIWSQQSQTADFVALEWRQPIAVNDIGLVAYHSGQPVLDLWGLADETARKARMESGDPDWLSGVVARSGVRLVAIYASWFPRVPAGWTLVGTIEGVPSVSSYQRTVDIYVVHPEDAGSVCGLLHDFAHRTQSDVTKVSCVI